MYHKSTKEAELNKTFKKRSPQVVHASEPFIVIAGANATTEERYIPGRVVIFESH